MAIPKDITANDGGDVQAAVAPSPAADVSSADATLDQRSERSEQSIRSGRTVTIRSSGRPGDPSYECDIPTFESIHSRLSSLREAYPGTIVLFRIPSADTTACPDLYVAYGDNSHHISGDHPAECCTVVPADRLLATLVPATDHNDVVIADIDAVNSVDIVVPSPRHIWRTYPFADNENENNKGKENDNEVENNKGKDDKVDNANEESRYYGNIVLIRNGFAADNEPQYVTFDNEAEIVGDLCSKYVRNDGDDGKVVTVSSRDVRYLMESGKDYGVTIDSSRGYNLETIVKDEGDLCRQSAARAVEALDPSLVAGASLISDPDLSPSLSADAQAQLAYDTEPLDARITNPHITGGNVTDLFRSGLTLQERLSGVDVFVARIDGVRFVQPIPPDLAEAYHKGVITMSTLANSMLPIYDERQAVKSAASDQQRVLDEKREAAFSMLSGNFDKAYYDEMHSNDYSRGVR